MTMCAAALVGAPACTAETDVSASEPETTTASGSFNFSIPGEGVGQAQPAGGFNFAPPGDTADGAAMPGLGNVALPDEADAVLQEFEPSVTKDAIPTEG